MRMHVFLAFCLAVQAFVPGLALSANSIVKNGQPVPYETPSISIPTATNPGIPEQAAAPAPPDPGKMVTVGSDALRQARTGTVKTADTAKDVKPLNPEERVVDMTDLLRQEILRPGIVVKEPFDSSIAPSRPRLDQIEDLRKMAEGEGAGLAPAKAPVVEKTRRPLKSSVLTIGPAAESDDEAPLYFPSRRKHQ